MDRGWPLERGSASLIERRLDLRSPPACFGVLESAQPTARRRTYSALTDDKTSRHHCRAAGVAAQRCTLVFVRIGRTVPTVVAPGTATASGPRAQPPSHREVRIIVMTSASSIRRWSAMPRRRPGRSQGRYRRRVSVTAAGLLPPGISNPSAIGGCLDAE